MTIAINKATNYIVGVIIENKEMKNEKSLRTLLKEELDPLTTKIGETNTKTDATNSKIDKVLDNQNLLILELREKGVIEKTIQIPTAV